MEDELTAKDDKIRQLEQQVMCQYYYYYYYYYYYFVFYSVGGSS